MATAKENLEQQLGKGNADAVEALIDERLRARSENLEELRREIVRLREDVGDIPELRRQLNAAAGLLRDTIDDHNEMAARRNAGEPVDEREVAEGEERVQRVSADVESVRDELEQRVTAIEQRLDDKNTGLAALHDRDEELQTQIDELRDARPTVTEVRSSKSGLKAAAITFVVVFLFVWLVIVVTPLEDWRWALVWAGFIAWAVGLLVGLASKEGTRLNTARTDWRDFRRERQEERQREARQDVEETPAERRHVVERVEETPAPAERRHVAERERASV